MVYLLFFFSGMAALIYQVAWMKMLTVEFGSTVYAVSTVLSVFMSGLAIGSWLFGRRVDTGTKPLVLYAMLEFLLGGYAVLFLFSIPLIHRFWVSLERSVHPSYESFSLVKLGVTFLLLLVPTTLMGGTLPVLSKYLGAARHARGRRLGFLYSFNTLGAMAGSLSISFFWILILGVRGSIYVAVAINLILGLGALALQRARGSYAGGEAPSESDPALTRTEQTDRAASEQLLAVPIAFVSGFVILACEVLWTRLFTNFLSGNALIFSTILISVLSGLAIGGFAASILGERVRKLGGLLGVSMMVGAGLLVLQVVGQSDIGRWFSAAYASESPYLPFLALFVVLAIPCTVLGVTFPVLLRWVGRSAATIGSDVGKLYAINTFGSVLGSLVAGFVLLRVLGVNGSLLALAAVYAAVAIPLFASRRVRVAAGVMVLVIIALLASAELRRSRYWFNGGFTVLREIPAEATEFLEEGVTTTVGIYRTGPVQHLTVNGLIVAETAKHDLWDLLSKAHLPMLIHPKPRRVALIGLGAGVSLGATQKYDLDVLDCIEISPEVVRACRRFERFNQRCLDDPRLELSVNDGRHFLMTTEKRYDVINVDPVDPPVCTLYTQDFFQVCYDRLETGGLMVQWVPLFRLSPDNIKVVLNAFLNVFEHCTIWYNGTAALLIGSRGEAMEIDVARFVERTLDPRVQESLALVDSPDPWMLLAMFVGNAGTFRDVFPDSIPSNTDDRPYLEYTVLRSKASMVPKEFWSLQMLGRFASRFEDYVIDGTFPNDYRAAFARKRSVTNAFVSGRLLLMEGRRDEAIELMTRAIREHRVTPAELRYMQSFYGIGGG